MPKGQSPKVKDSISNIPISKIDSNFNSFPRPVDSKRMIVSKLKSKVEYREQVIFEPVRPRIIQSSLNYLKANNHLRLKLIWKTYQ